MSKQIKMTSPDGVTLYTAGKYVPEDIHVINGLPTYDGANENGEVVVSVLKRILDGTKSAKYLFYNYAKDDLNELISYNDTENVEDFDYAFNGFKGTKLPEINTNSLKKCTRIFEGCENVETFHYINTTNATDCTFLYSKCKKGKIFPELDLSNATNVAYLYSNCSAAESLPPINAPKIKSLNRVYSECNKLKVQPLWVNVENVTDLENSFYRCGELLEIIIPYMPNLNRLVSTFKECSKVKKIEIPIYNPSNEYNSGQVFYECFSLKALIIRSFGSIIAKTDTFQRCYHILGTTNSTYNPDGLQDGYIYVPRDMIETLSSATNWSTLATQFRALEDYTKDGTCWGEFDDEKAGI